MSVLVDVEFYLRTVEFYRAVLEPLLAHDFCEVVERGNLLGIVAPACLDYLLCFFISIAAVAAYDGAAYAAVEHTGGRVHLEYARECQLLFIGAQGAYAVAEVFGEHGDYAVHEIHRSGAFLGLAVKERVGAHVVCHIGDVYTNLVVAVGKQTERQSIVEILGILGRL